MSHIFTHVRCLLCSQSRLTHEQGAKHQANLRLHFKEGRKRRLNEERQERELKEQLEAAEKVCMHGKECTVCLLLGSFAACRGLSLQCRSSHVDLSHPAAVHFSLALLYMLAAFFDVCAAASHLGSVLVFFGSDDGDVDDATFICPPLLSH